MLYICDIFIIIKIQFSQYKSKLFNLWNNIKFYYINLKKIFNNVEYFIIIFSRFY